MQFICITFNHFHLQRWLGGDAAPKLPHSILQKSHVKNKFAFEPLVYSVYANKYYITFIIH